MGKMYKLDRTGHGEVTTWGDDADSRKAGAQAFDELAAKHFTMFDVGPQGETPGESLGRKLDAFDPDAEEIIAVPRMVAG